jgi:ribosomal protein L37AE/L43A
MPLTVAEDKYGAPAPTRFVLANGFDLPADIERIADDAPAAVVVVNKGRWIARCPFCRGAELAARLDERFLCGSCRNKAAGGRWIRAVLPANAERIEEVLMARPDIENRNWETYETVEDLVAENVEHDV